VLLQPARAVASPTLAALFSLLYIRGDGGQWGKEARASSPPGRDCAPRGSRPWRAGCRSASWSPSSTAGEAKMAAPQVR
jgi:hypothetical protein